MSDEVRSRWEAEVGTIPARRQARARRALRLELLDRPVEAARAWESLREDGRAAASYRQAGEYGSAARCHERLGQDLEALAMYARSPEERSQEYAGLKRCFRRLDSRSLAAVGAVEKIARTLRKEQDYRAAATLFGLLGRPYEAGTCLDLAGDPEQAFLLWAEDLRSADICRRACETGRFGAGVTALRSLLSEYRMPGPGYAIHARQLATLLEAWWKTDPSDGTRRQVAGALASCRDECRVEFVADILLPLGQLDRVYQTASKVLNAMRDQGDTNHAKARWAGLAETLEGEGNAGAAGLWYLCAGRPADARRCWGDMAADDRNVDCLREAGMRRRVAEMYLSTGRPAIAAREFREMGEFGECARILAGLGRHREAAVMLEQAGLFEEASRYYLDGGSLREAGRMLERLKRWAGAADLYKRAGYTQGYRRCARKLSPASQVSLPGM